MTAGFGLAADRVVMGAAILPGLEAVVDVIGGIVSSIAGMSPGQPFVESPQRSMDRLDQRAYIPSIESPENQSFGHNSVRRHADRQPITWPDVGPPPNHGRTSTPRG